jgi:putative transposase
MFVGRRLVGPIRLILQIVPRSLPRYHGSGDFHFITCSCYQRQPFLGTAPRRDLFLKVLEQVRRRYPVVIVGYVVMPEHFHLPISEPQRGTPSTVLQALKLGFTRRVLGEWKRRGTSQQAFWEPPHQLWQPRFYGFNVWSERKRIEKLRYLHQNPVKRALVLEPEPWRWSSFRSYFCGETGRVRINDCSVLQMTVREKAA